MPCGPLDCSRPGHAVSKRADDVERAEHRGDEDVEPRALADEKFRDVAIAHVAGAAQSGLEVAAAPVPGRIEQRRLLGEHCLGRG